MEAPQFPIALRSEASMAFTDLVEAQRRTDQQIAALTEAQLQTNYRLDTLTNDMAEVKGIVLELRYRDRAYAYFAPLDPPHPRAVGR